MIYFQQEQAISDIHQLHHDQKEAPLNVIQEEVGRIVRFQQELQMSSERLQEKRANIQELIDLGTKFSQGTEEERQRYLDSTSLNSFGDIFSGLVNSAQSKVENTLFLLCLAAI